MRMLLVLVIVAFLTPSTLNAGLSVRLSHERQGLAMCHDQCEIVDRALRQQDLALLKGLLIQGGVAIASPNRSIPNSCLESAAQAWNKVLKRPIVRVAANDEEANFYVSAVDGIGEDRVQQGQIEIDRQPNGTIFANVSVDERYDGRLLTKSEISAVITHELGHFLGLDDSSGRDRIMGEFDATHLVTSPSQEEAVAVELMRGKILTAIAAVLGDSLP